MGGEDCARHGQKACSLLQEMYSGPHPTCPPLPLRTSPAPLTCLPPGCQGRSGTRMPATGPRQGRHPAPQTWQPTAAARRRLRCTACTPGTPTAGPTPTRAPPPGRAARQWRRPGRRRRRQRQRQPLHGRGVSSDDGVRISHSLCQGGIGSGSSLYVNRGGRGNKPTEP